MWSNLERPAFWRGERSSRKSASFPTPLSRPARCSLAATKDKPQINSQIDSYALWLLYQTDTDVYLLDSLPAGGTLIDDDVMRITQDQVIRMDYNTAP